MAGKIPGGGRAPTPEERLWLELNFPNLTEYSVTHSLDKDWNCIGWSLCSVQEGWVWPGDNVQDFDFLYGQHGWQPSENCLPEDGKKKIALFCKDDVPTHAAKQVEGDWWESKLGRGPRIIHRLNEIEGDIRPDDYGNVYKCYERKI